MWGPRGGHAANAIGRRSAAPIRSLVVGADLGGRSASATSSRPGTRAATSSSDASTGSSSVAGLLDERIRPPGTSTPGSASQRLCDGFGNTPQEDAATASVAEDALGRHRTTPILPVRSCVISSILLFTKSSGSAYPVWWITANTCEGRQDGRIRQRHRRPPSQTSSPRVLASPSSRRGRSRSAARAALDHGREVDRADLTGGPRGRASRSCRRSPCQGDAWCVRPVT